MNVVKHLHLQTVLLVELILIPKHVDDVHLLVVTFKNAEYCIERDEVFLQVLTERFYQCLYR